MVGLRILFHVVTSADRILIVSTQQIASDEQYMALDVSVVHEQCNRQCSAPYAINLQTHLCATQAACLLQGESRTERWRKPGPTSTSTARQTVRCL